MKTFYALYNRGSHLRRAMSSLSLSKLKKKAPAGKPDKPKKKIDRFDGLTEEEVQKYTLPDYLEMDLDMVFVGINPSLMAAHRGRYYAGPGNHFYKLLHESGLVPRFVSFEEDHKLLQYGIGLTNIVARATRSSADLKRTEIKEGAKIVEEKLKFCKPKVAVFNGKCIYEVYANKSGNFHFGLQPERIGNTAVWVTPSSSARCANFPRMVDKLHFYTALKKYLQFLKGEIKDVDAKEFQFEGKCKQFIPRTSKMWRRKNLSAFLYGGRIANKDTVCLDTSEENVAMAHSTEFLVLKDKLETDDNDNETSTTDKREIAQNLEAFLSQEQTENHTNNAPVEKENAELDLNLKSDEGAVATCNLALSKLPINNHRKKRKVKRLSPKQARMNNYSERGVPSDFVSLIKQRLHEKADNTNNGHEEKPVADKEIKPSSIKSKLERFGSKNSDWFVDTNVSSVSD